VKAKTWKNSNLKQPHYNVAAIPPFILGIIFRETDITAS